MKDIRLLVSRMDVLVDDVSVLRVFRLRNADPQETADQLASLFPDPTTQQNSSRNGFPGFFGGFDRNRGGGNRSTDQNSRNVKQSRVAAVPDPRTSSVIVSASRDLMDEIAGIIEELDSDPAKKKKVFVIKVENRDPKDVVEDLQSVIAADSSGGNLNSTRSSANQSGSQLNSRQQNTLQNQGNNNNSGFLNNNNSRQRTGQ
jgi:type II secretory pathway component GspD/PulD (secretin)